MPTHSFLMKSPVPSKGVSTKKPAKSSDSTQPQNELCRVTRTDPPIPLTVPFNLVNESITYPQHRSHEYAPLHYGNQAGQPFGTTLLWQPATEQCHLGESRRSACT